MTGADYSSQDIDQHGTNVEEDVSSPFADLRRRAEESRIPEGAFSLLEPGSMAIGMTNGITDRLVARLQEFQDGFGDMSEMLHTSASTYRGMEDDNTGDIDTIQV